jgi:hypothetical protein
MDSLNGAVAVLNPVNKKVCCKMDIGAIKKVAAEYDVTMLITDGSGTMPVIPESTGPAIIFVKEGYT